MAQTVDLAEGFRATREAGGIRVEVTDCHTRTFLLTYELIDRLRRGSPLKGASILILVNDQTLHGFFAEVLSEARLTVIPSVGEAKALLAAYSYDLVLVTNFGLSNQDAVSIISVERTFPAVLVSGAREAQAERECAAKGIRCIWAPFGPEFRNTLEDILLQGMLQK